MSQSSRQFHLWFFLFLTVLFSFCWKNFAWQFFVFSSLFNLYLRLLEFSFKITQREAFLDSIINKPLVIIIKIFAVLRLLLTALVCAYLIIKFKFTIFAFLSAFLCYQLILIMSPFLWNIFSQKSSD